MIQTGYVSPSKLVKVSSNENLSTGKGSREKGPSNFGQLSGEECILEGNLVTSIRSPENVLAH